MKTSTVTPSFYYVFNISLSCNINIPSFIGNLWWDLLLGNHLKKAQCVSNRCKDLNKQTKYFGVMGTLKTSLVQINSKMNSKQYDYRYLYLRFVRVNLNSLMTLLPSVPRLKLGYGHQRDFSPSLYSNSRASIKASCRLTWPINIIIIILIIIVSITKFPIVIGSRPAYLSRNRRAITWVSDLNFFKSDTCNWIPTWFSRQLRVLYSDFLSNVFYIFQNLGKSYGRFRPKEVLRRYF